MMRILFELCVASMSLYILYKADPSLRWAHTTYTIVGIFAMANAVSSLAGSPPAHTLLLEHYGVAIGITLKFAHLLKTRARAKAPKRSNMKGSRRHA